MNKIDLTKSQLVTEDIKVRVWNDYKSAAEVRYLHSVNHKRKRPYTCWVGGYKGSEYDDASHHLYSWKNAELIETRYKVKEFYDLVETLKGQGYEYSHGGHFWTKTELTFYKEMFDYCGYPYDPDNNDYTWREEWLEEIDDIQRTK